MTAKSQLQVECQSKGIPLPHYVSAQTGPAHCPKWKCQVNLEDAPVSCVIGDECETKKAAENSAAIKMLLRLSAGENSRPSSPAVSRNRVLEVKIPTALLVDVENLPKLISQLPKFKGPLTIYAFVGKHHPHASTDFGPEVIKVISPSTRIDGTDTCIQVYAGKFLMENKYELYLVATRDHFGSALVEIISSDYFEWAPKEAALVTTVEHIFEITD